ncbi:MAG: PEP-CTERM sorting domain-containing protein [Planctomycetaceae bacterium]
MWAIPSNSPRFSRLCLIALFAISLFSLSRLDAAVISNYAFDGNPADSAVTVAPAGATFSDFTRTNLVDESHPNTFRSSGFSTGSSIDTTQFKGFTVTASGALSLAFEALSFDHNRSGKGPDTGEIRYSFDGFATLAASFVWAIATANTNQIWDFTDFTLDPGETVEFRFFGYNADTGTGSKFFELDNVGFIEQAAVPEPGSLSLAAMALVLGVGSRYTARRRRKS